MYMNRIIKALCHIKQASVTQNQYRVVLNEYFFVVKLIKAVNILFVLYLI